MPRFFLKNLYILGFLDLSDRYLEKDLEDAILRDIEKFLLELGVGFTFIARQKRLQIDNDDFYIDLEKNQWRNCFAAIPFEDRGSTWEVRYYVCL